MILLYMCLGFRCVETEFDFHGNVDWSRKPLVNFNVGKTQLNSFNRSHNFGALDLLMDGSLLDDEIVF